MALRTILLGDNNPKLRKISRCVDTFDDRLLGFIEDLKETMAYENGVGLAAPQVGVLKRVVVIDVGDGPLELINPELIFKEGQLCDLEGCLSLPEENGYVIRPERVVVRAKNAYGKPVQYEARDLFARAVCHEIDHLDGVLFADLIIKPTQEMLDEIERRHELERDKIEK